MDDQSFKRIIDDVCAIFKDVTGIEAKPTREAQNIVHWAKQGWSNHDFRMVIEYQFSDPHASKWFLEQPERINLRMMLNQSREHVLSDMIAGLRASSRLKEKKTNSTAPGMMPMMQMRCGAKIPLGDKAGYDEHMRECFEIKGACFV